MNNIKLLDYFAGQALNAMIAATNNIDDCWIEPRVEHLATMASTAYEIATAMLLQRVQLMDKDSILDELTDQLSNNA